MNQDKEVKILEQGQSDTLKRSSGPALGYPSKRRREDDTKASLDSKADNEPNAAAEAFLLTLPDNLAPMYALDTTLAPWLALFAIDVSQTVVISEMSLGLSACIDLSNSPHRAVHLERDYSTVKAAKDWAEVMSCDFFQVLVDKKDRSSRIYRIMIHWSQKGLFKLMESDKTLRKILTQEKNSGKREPRKYLGQICFPENGDSTDQLAANAAERIMNFTSAGLLCADLVAFISLPLKDRALAMQPIGKKLLKYMTVPRTFCGYRVRSFTIMIALFKELRGDKTGEIFVREFEI